MDFNIRQGDEPFMQFDSMTLRNYLPMEIFRLSVMQIKETKSFDMIGHPVRDGLYDGRMGPSAKFDRCETCNQQELHCPGHVGHIQLTVPVFNPVLYNFSVKLMKGSCVQCHRLTLNSNGKTARLFRARMRCLELGIPDAIEWIDKYYNNGDFLHKLDCADPEDVLPFMDHVDNSILEYINKFVPKQYGGKTIKQLKAMNLKTKPHKVMVDLKNGLLKDFQRTMFKRERICPICKGKNGKLINDGARCLLIDFETTSSRSKKNAVTKSKGGLLPDEYEEELEPEDKELKNNENTAIVNTSTKMGAEVLAEQIRSVASGTCMKLAWRGAETREHFRLLWENESDLLQKTFPMFEDATEGCPLDGLFCEIVMVPPCKYRPIRMFKGDKYENPQTVNLRKLLEADEVIKCIRMILDGTAKEKRQQMMDNIIKTRVKGNSLQAMMHNAYLNLQNRMNVIFDQDLDKSGDKMLVPGIKQILEKKQGLFRMNMMGKRVNFACRSVITPDPYLDIDEIGIPEVFAKKLTFTEPVNQYNVEQMRKLVNIGPAHHPGANYVQLPNGQKKFLHPSKPEERATLAKQLKVADANRLQAPVKVLRHLKKGDMIVMNRQPSLHKPSMMGHRARVLTGQRALRMNYAPCKAYNADFDGDEMNGHLTQSHLAQVEVGEIANVGNNFLVPKDASPLLGLIQDHVVSGVLLTVRGRLLNKEDFMHLLLAAFAENTKKLKIPHPCMVKPVELWSGKQVITAILMNCVPEDEDSSNSDQKPIKVNKKINLYGTAKTPVKCWKVRGYPTPDKNNISMTESEVVFRQGELLVGVLDKQHYGATNFGLVHCCFELYGHRVGIQVLSCFSRLFTTYLQFHGFTLGVADILCLPEADKRRRKAVRDSRKIGNQVVINTFGLDENASAQEIKRVLAATYCNPKGIGADVAALDRGMKQAIRPFNDEINSACVPDGLIRLFPENGLQMMIESGAKGSAVNAMQISCALGQIELEGKRMATTIAGRTLPSFRCFDPSPRAGGFIDQRFLTGINPQELFFHTMAGREGLIDTAVKTSRSGYLQRCIIKHLEGIKVHYDATCRDHDGSIIQFRYGEDGMDVCASSFMSSTKQFDFLEQNQPALDAVVKPDIPRINKIFQYAEAREHYEEVKKNRKQKNAKMFKGRNAGFLRFSQEHCGRPRKDIMAEWNELTEEEKREMTEQGMCKNIEAVDEKFNPFRTLGALPEKMLNDIDDYFKIKHEKKDEYGYPSPDGDSATYECGQDEELRATLCWKGLKSMASPGENVGLLAAQSIGEPSTQMTLNTFHFAGRGEMNVTLGIPRLREILMTAGKNIATPMAEIKVKPDATVEDIERIKRTLDRVYLKQVIKKFSLDERVNLKAGETWRRYVLRIELLPKERREKEAQHLNNKAILDKIEYHLTGQKVNRGDADEEPASAGPPTRGKGFIQTLDGFVRRKMDQIDKHMSMHVTRVRSNQENGSDDLPSRAGARAADDESSDEEADGGKDADADERRLNKRHRDDAADYEGEEEDRGAVENENEPDVIEDDEGAAVSDHENEDEDVSENNVSRADVADRIMSVKTISPSIVGYQFDVKHNKWCEVTFSFSLRNKSKVDLGSLVEQAVESFIVHETPGIEKCIFDSDKYTLSTQGVNRSALLGFHDILDINTFYSNDLNFMLSNYGVEACSRSIVKEMSSVFEVYGIRPSKRHLTLTADYMTFTGQIQPFNRGAMASSASPLQKMTFETTIAFMRESLVTGEKDTMSSPSSRIVLGSLMRGGTGAFDLFLDPNYVEPTEDLDLSKMEVEEDEDDE